MLRVNPNAVTAVNSSPALFTGAVLVLFTFLSHEASGTLGFLYALATCHGFFAWTCRMAASPKNGDLSEKRYH